MSDLAVTPNTPRTQVQTPVTTLQRRVGRGRIIHVIGDGRPGGGTTFVLNLSCALRANGFDLVIVGPLGSHLLDEAFRTGTRAIGINFGRRRDVLTSAFKLRRQLQELGPALVHVHGARAGLPVVISRVWARVPMIYTVHGLHFHHKAGLVHGAGRMAEAMCFKCARETVFVSEGDRTFAEVEGILQSARRHSVLRNAIPPLEDEIRAQTYREKQYDIVFMGRLEPQKNPLILADILARLSSKSNMCIVGGGSLEGELRRRIEVLGLSSQVVWCGQLDRNSALRQAARARVMLLPSLWEGQPLSVIEAMQLGLPVVASDVPGTAEIVVDGETGCLVPSTDSAAYATRIQTLLADGRLREHLGQAGACRAHKLFSFDDHVHRHIELYARHLPLDAEYQHG